MLPMQEWTKQVVTMQNVTRQNVAEPYTSSYLQRSNNWPWLDASMIEIQFERENGKLEKN